MIFQTNKRKGFTPGFTLIELIASLVIGLLVVVLMVNLGHFLEAGPESIALVRTQYDTFAEMEDIISDYRDALESGNLNLDSLLNNWSNTPGLTLTRETVSVSATDGSYTFSNVTRVVVSKGGQSATAYFTE